MKVSRVLTFIFLAFVLMIIGYSFKYSAEARFGPLVIGIPAAILLIVQIIRENFIQPRASAKAKNQTAASGGSVSQSGESLRSLSEVVKKIPSKEPIQGAPIRVIQYTDFRHSLIEIAACLIGLILGIYIFGLLIGITIFMIMYLKLHRVSWLMTAILGLGVPAFIFGVFEVGIHMALYEGLFLHY